MKTQWVVSVAAIVVAVIALIFTFIMKPEAPEAPKVEAISTAEDIAKASAVLIPFSIKSLTCRALIPFTCAISDMLLSTLFIN